MRIKNIESLPAVNTFKNKEDFCNRLIQEVILICKNNPIYSKPNKKTIELSNIKSNLINKIEKLDSLLEKSKDMKKDLNSKIDILVEDNSMYKEKLLNILHSKEEL